MRRKKSENVIWMVAQLAGLVILLSLTFPQVRKAISAVGFVAVSLFGAALVGLVGFGLYRWATRSQTSSTSDALVPSSQTDANTTALGVPRIETQPQNYSRKPTGQPTDADRRGPARNSPQTTAELLDQLRSIDWFQFEKIVALAYGKLGYTVTRRGGANPDGGIDLVIERDGHRSAVQCKQWKKWSVGVKAIREFLGALTDAGIQKGIFITLRGYTSEAKKLAEKHGIEIVNEVGLARMLESTDYRFDPETLSILRHRQKFCPKCEEPMVLRTAGKGPGTGKQFWGCSTYPRCEFTMPIRAVAVTPWMQIGHNGLNINARPS